MNAGEKALAEAREWLGTPYVHQASVKGAGTDCLGLLSGVWRAIYSAEPEPVPPYTGDWSEASGEERLWAAARRHLIELPAAGGDDFGQVILFRMREGSVAKHLGMISETGAAARFIHAYTGHGVIESPLSIPWRRRIVARFQFPEGAK